MKSIAAIAIDYGGVLAHDHCEPYQSEIAKCFKITVKQSRALLSEKTLHGAAYRLNNISQQKFWDEVAKLAGYSGPIDYDFLQLLWAKTYIVDLRVYNLLKLIKVQSGIKLCLLTNSDKLRSEYMESTFHLNELFDYVIASWHFKVIKPNPEAYTNLKKILNLEESPEKILFIDDRQTTVSAGISQGLTGYIYSNYNSLAKFLFKRFKLVLHAN